MFVEIVVGNDSSLSVGASGASHTTPTQSWAALAHVVHAAALPVNSVIISELEPVEEVAAVYVHEDEENILHVFTVVPEHTNDVYDRLLRAEERIERRLKSRVLHFHVRAHQGRRPQSAVPLTSKPIFLR